MRTVTLARTGVVLAGGFASRFEDGDKMKADLSDKPLLAHAIEGISPAVDTVVVSCRKGQLGGFTPICDSVKTPVTLSLDSVPNRGPAAGIANALETVQTSAVAVTAGDMPFVDASFLSELLNRLEDGDADAIVPEVDGYSQPTCAVYRTAALRETVEPVTNTGGASLQDVIDGLDATVLPENVVRSLTSRRTFFDVNTVEALERADELANADAPDDCW